jgi:hypothetical protein
MKKINIAVCAVLCAAFFTGASVWEGSAEVSGAEEFPGGAYYAATNSFPYNTVVDVTNLENGKTIRVIIAGGLDSPGLLAKLSPNTAAAIGIPNQGIGRIRMTEPSEDVSAYPRLTDDLERPESPGSGDSAAAGPEDSFYTNVINQSETYTPEPIEYPADVRVEPQPNWVSLTDEPAPRIPENPPEAYIPEAARPFPVSQPYPAVPAPQAALAPSSPPVIILIPAEERPPEGESATIPPGTIIGPIPLHQLAPEGEALDPRYFITPVNPNHLSAAVLLQPAPETC